MSVRSGISLRVLSVRDDDGAPGVLVLDKQTGETLCELFSSDGVDDLCARLQNAATAAFGPEGDGE